MEQRAIQDDLPENYCWGCGSLNPSGMHIKSYWEGDETICTWQPRAEHMVGPQGILNGGIIATPLRAQIKDRTERKTVITCTLSSRGEACARGEIVAVRVPLSWRDGEG